MKRYVLLTAALVALGLAAAACGDDDNGGDTGTPTTSLTTGASGTPAGTAVAPSTTAATSTSTAATSTPTAAASVCAVNPAPATSDQEQVDSPLPGEIVTSPLQITGRVAAFEAAFRVTLYDAGGGTIADQMAMSSEGQTLAPFSVSLPFTVTQNTPVCLWVYENSARDGLPIHVIQIPLTLQP